MKTFHSAVFTKDHPKRRYQSRAEQIPIGYQNNGVSNN